MFLTDYKEVNGFSVPLFIHIFLSSKPIKHETIWKNFTFGAPIPLFGTINITTKNLKYR